MKKIYKSIRYLYKLYQQFYRDQRGVYMYLGFFLSLIVLGLVALAVDGSGIYLDKARFIQAMDQGALSVATENNTKYRENTPNHDDIKRQILGPEHNNSTEEQKFATKQEKRNQELVQGLVKVYLRSYDRSNPNNSSLPIRIEDDFKINCTEEKHAVNINGVSYVKKPIVCQVSGEIKRKSWLPLENKISFEKEVDINSGVTFGVKDKGIPTPIDLMFVLDFSSSMTSDVNNNYKASVQNHKITILRDVVGEISDSLLPAKQNSSVSPYNRIGFVTFASAAQQNKDRSKCVLPYYPNTTVIPAPIAKDVRIQIDSIEYKDGKPVLDEKGNIKRHKHSVLNDQKVYIEPPTKFYKPDILRNGSCEDYPGQKPNGLYCKVDINIPNAVNRGLNLVKIDEDNLRTFMMRLRNYYYLDPTKTDTIKQIDRFNGENINYPLTFKDAPNTFTHEKLCGDLKTKEYTTQAWFDNKNRGVKDALDKIPTRDGTNITSGFLVGANLLMGVNTNPDATPAKLGTNTQRVLLVLSDGQDNFPAWDTAIEFLKAGMCTKTKEKADSLQDKGMRTLPTRIGFVAFGYVPNDNIRNAWKSCVGNENYFEVKDKSKLLESFKQIIGLQEEVGKTSITKPTF